MKCNRKLISALMSIVLMLNLFVSTVSAAEYQADYLTASYKDIAVSAYSRMLELHNGAIAVQNDAGLWGLADLAGNMILPFQFKMLEPLGNGFYRVSPDKAYSWGNGTEGIIDSTGTYRIPLGDYVFEMNNQIICQYFSDSQPNAYYHNTDLSPATRNEFWGYNPGSNSGNSGIDDSTPPQLDLGIEYDSYEITDCGFILCKDYEYAFVDFNKQVLIPYGTYDYIYQSSTDGCLFVYDGQSGTYGVLNVSAGTAQVAIAPGIYTDVLDSGYPGVFMVQNSNYEHGMVSVTGAVIVPVGSYDYLGSVNDKGFIATCNYDYDSNYNKTNFDSRLYHVSNGLVRSWTDRQIGTETYYRDVVFSLNGSKHGFMDEYGNALLSPVYDLLEPIGIDGHIRTYRKVSNQYVYGLLSTNTYRFLMDELYSSIYHLGQNHYQYCRDRFYGINAVADDVVYAKIPCIYKQLNKYSFNFIYAYDGSKYSVLNIDNQYVIEPSYEEITIFKTDDLNPSYLTYMMDDYDGYTDTILPYVSMPSTGYLTSYIDYRTGEVRGTLAAIASNLTPDGWFAYQDPITGKYGIGRVTNLPSPFTGLQQDASGVWWYYVDGIVQTGYTGLVYFNDAFFYVENGMLAAGYTGLVYFADTFYYVENGVVNFGYTGLVFCGDTFYYVENGILNFGYTGLVFCGDAFYYVENGILNFGYTGLVFCGDAFYYVENGILNFGYTGLIFCGDAFYYVENGILNFGYTGLVFCGDAFYYVENGILNFGYTGLVYCGDAFYYVENGILNFGYTGLVYFADVFYYVENGVLNFGYTGPVYFHGVWYDVVGGILYP